MVDRRKIEGKFVINLALDTNMLWGNPLGWPDLSRISMENEGKAVDGGRRDENHEHTHTKHDTRRSLTPVATGPT